MEEDRSDWGGLAPEILIKIFSRLDIENRWKGPMFVCKSWLTVCRDPYFWSIFDPEEWLESTHCWSLDFVPKVNSMLRSVVDWSDGGLTEIRVRNCNDDTLSYLADRCPKLQVLDITGSPNVTDASMAKIAFGCRSLRELDITYCYQLSEDTLVMIGRNCPDLRILKRNRMDWPYSSGPLDAIFKACLDSCPQDGDAEAYAIGEHMINLVRLESEFSNLSVKGLASICEGCSKLEYLNLFGCAHLSRRDIANNVSKLKSLEVKMNALLLY